MKIGDMNFMHNSTLSSSGPTGEAPQLSPTYAEYDDGAKVFPLYLNFAGSSSCISGWTCSSQDVSFWAPE